MKVALYCFFSYSMLGFLFTTFVWSYKYRGSVFRLFAGGSGDPGMALSALVAGLPVFRSLLELRADFGRLGVLQRP